jgi:hypothetical protein
MSINFSKCLLIIITGFFFLSGAFAVKTYDLNLLGFSEKHFYKLNELINETFDSINTKVYEYDSINEFTQTTGAPFFICAFSNKQGIHIQSKYLLGDRFKMALTHELVHYTIRMQFPVPLWFEEGLVCLVTEEFSGVTDIIAMKNVEEYDIRNAENNWELVSYCLGCIKKVQGLLSLDATKQAIP